MATFDLNTIDEFLVARIVKKFNSMGSGINFYRSCRGAKDFVERVKPAWPLPNIHLVYEERGRYIYKHPNVWNWGQPCAKLPLEFCRVECVRIRDAEENMMTLVIPEIQAMGAVEHLHLSGSYMEILWGDFSMEKIQLLMSTAKPKAVTCHEHNYDQISPYIQDVKSLHFEAICSDEDGPSLWETRKIFERMVNRKVNSWSYFYFEKNAITSFLENWLKGKSTDSLATLSFSIVCGKLRTEDMDEVVNHAGIQTLMKSCVKLQKGYILEREGHGQVRICISCENPRKIDFHFS